ncbi:MAG: alcohol dehydrogenase catalytic domain-containing protein [Candidatus Gastranaerophilales bacterium]|nr:alcohol dehydrogenase catalytic domain-containing protein [Candidatus Gastranaerophilales bacterium]MCM1073073.1 alcohol dehydrogenase catalytic domain-containing protein [Bacteroides sp.]
MKTAIVSNEQIIINETEDIKLDGRKGAIVKVLGCGLCGSDIVKFKHKIVKDGAVLGHEIVAIIDEINSDTDFKAGERIVTSHHIPCFECTYCKHGNYSMCAHFKATNIFPGGFSEKVFVSEEHLQQVAYRVPEHMGDEEISFYEPLGCCIRAIKRCNLQKEDKVLVVGLGSIGLLMGEGLKAFGYDVYGCDLIKERLELANQMGIKPLPENFEADAVFMTSGADKAIDTALKNIKMGGKILVFSSTPNNWGYANNEIYYKELTVMGSYSPSPADLRDSFELLVSGKVNVKNLSTVYPLDKIQEAFDDTVSNKIFKAYISVNEKLQILNKNEQKHLCNR